MNTEYITAAQWAAIRPFLPDEPHDGQSENRLFAEGVLRMLITGTNWEKWPEALGNRYVAHERMQVWLQEGTWLRIYDKLHPLSAPAGAIMQLWQVYYDDLRKQGLLGEEDPVLVELAENSRKMQERAKELLVLLPTLSEEDQQAAMRAYLHDLANADISKYQVKYPEEYLRLISKLEGDGEVS
ncbi:transposase [Hymenobacter defluvii]|uniref:Transposase n=1 Tax=Hymenobacter defluvii TaxID=2054411 RepID=A0ABS3TES0_9BACT|nr:transposase [Hymenobacter defluvii]MBO3272152.1 transposase [Hymenobacter defluvii]